MKSTPDPFDKPLVLPPKPPEPQGHTENWLPHPREPGLEYDAGFPGVNKPMRPRQSETQG